MSRHAIYQSKEEKRVESPSSVFPLYEVSLVLQFLYSSVKKEHDYCKLTRKYCIIFEDDPMLQIDIRVKNN